MLANTIQDHVQDKGATDAMLAAAPHRIGAITLVVHDLDRVAKFYTEAIGLAIIDRSAAEARLGVGSATLVILRRDPAARRFAPQEAGLFHTAFLLPERAELSAWLRHAAGLGLSLQGASDHLVSEALYLADPEGNGIEIYVDRPPSVWPRDAEGIVLATQRLDLPGLAAASDRAWSGMPRGGQIGHVHLQVGDLSMAEAFYGGVLGLNVTSRGRDVIFYGSGGYHHQLASNVWNSRGATERSGAATGLAEIEVTTDPAQIKVTRARATSGVIRADATDRLTLVDPWGTPITLVSSEN